MRTKNLQFLFHSVRVGAVGVRLTSPWIQKSQNSQYSPRSRLGRGVRSDAQLSCTETRFQKYSQSGKNGFKHPMLSISMDHNVISYRKIERNTQKIKIADFTM